MPFIYHKKPEQMIGNVLYPLNILKDVDERAYKNAIAKYKSREDLMKEKIPKLNCFWNDVLHCISLHPNLIFDKMKEVGLNPPACEWYKIDIKQIKTTSLALYTFDSDSPMKIPENEIKIMTIDEYREITAVPEKAKSWYRKLAKDGGKIKLPFRFIPHVFVKGTIDITDTEILTFADV